MKKIYAIVATALVATSIFFVQKNDSECLFDANVEALARSEESNCTFGTVIKKESSHTLLCRGNGSLCCKW